MRGGRCEASADGVSLNVMLMYIGCPDTGVHRRLHQIADEGAQHDRDCRINRQPCITG